ncbi:hypothetical protein ZIOFF_014762 [Zingiber officinale]|uniref:dUTP diphosphatase n=1 Tax=Zingiber officinale TaxID=94328 RepID=A0A8J5LEJ8_ZINOF|nr:hypothetical protein ZIOFF_014762 [Zingiber officinale]
MQERASIVPAEVLYHSRRNDAHHRVYVHRSEEAILVTSNQVDRAFIQPESFTQLQRSRMRFLHMGLMQVRIQILHRQEEGTLALVVFRDNRWQGDQAIFATMEIDLTHGSQLVYVIPDTMLTVSDFYRNIQVSILARGYENWRNGEANLLVTRGLVGRLSNTPNVGFAYEIQNVVDYLASHGVRALPGRSYNTRDVLGHNWVIRQSTVNIPMQPIEVNTRNMLDGSVSLQFNQYQAATSSSLPKFNSKDEEIQSDEEELTSHTIAVLVEEESCDELLVKRISSLAQLPIRRTPGAAGYDISITHAQDIPALNRSLLSTGICIQIPQNTYARIAPRSSTALKGIIIMGGVIDSDYRGEVKVMAFNTTNEDIFRNKQECIAQLIIEHIATPNVCSSTKANPLCLGCHYCCSDEDCAEEYDKYVATCSKAPKQKEIISPLTIKPFPEEQLLAIQKKARQPMDPFKRRRIDNATMGGNNSSVASQAQQQSNPTFEEPYHFLAQYKEVSSSHGPRVCTILEEDARRHLADIERTVANQLIHNILELKLIHDIKEADFSIRSEHPKGLYFKDALPSVSAVKKSLFTAFLQLQDTIQHMGTVLIVSMSRCWEEHIQEWYTKSHTSNLEYLDLAKTEKHPTKRELAHNISVIYDRVCLSCRVHLKNFKQIQEQLEELKVENQKLGEALKNLTTEVLENKPLTKRQLEDLIIKITEQPKQIEQQALQLSEELKRKIERKTCTVKRCVFCNELTRGLYRKEKEKDRDELSALVGLVITHGLSPCEFESAFIKANLLWIYWAHYALSSYGVKSFGVFTPDAKVCFLDVVDKFELQDVMDELVCNGPFNVGQVSSGVFFEDGAHPWAVAGGDFLVLSQKVIRLFKCWWTGMPSPVMKSVNAIQWIREGIKEGKYVASQHDAYNHAEKLFTVFWQYTEHDCFIGAEIEGGEGWRLRSAENAEVGGVLANTKGRRIVRNWVESGLCRFSFRIVGFGIPHDAWRVGIAALLCLLLGVVLSKFLPLLINKGLETEDAAAVAKDS